MIGIGPDGRRFGYPTRVDGKWATWCEQASFGNPHQRGRCPLDLVQATAMA
ncbi:MAG: hypothetical protein RIQ64_241, partial [Actinomycetota bacterium]